MKALIATDGSHNANEAAKMFATLPHAGPLEVHILTVIYMPPDDSGGMAYAWLPEFIQTEEARAKEGFEKIASLFVGDDVVTNHMICHGHVGHTITEEARRAAVDLIVIGAQGHSAIARVLLGSTSDFVATQAGCSVLAVRSDKLPSTTSPMRVVIAYDGSEPAKLAVDEFVKSSWATQCDLHLVHVLPHGSMFTRATSQDFDAARQDGRTMIEEVAQRLKPSVSNVATHLLEGDSIGQVITEFSQQNGVDLVMLGDTGRSAISQLFLGSVTRYVLRHAECSVWIARKPRG